MVGGSHDPPVAARNREIVPVARNSLTHVPHFLPFPTDAPSVRFPDMLLRRHGITRRLVAALLALWFAVVATEGARVHACAMHGGSAAVAGHDGHGAHAGHGAPAHGQQPHQCTCPDTSCGTAIVALATPRLTAHFGIAVADVEAVFSPASGRRPIPPPHLTPFANGPPVPALA